MSFMSKMPGRGKQMFRSISSPSLHLTTAMIQSKGTAKSRHTTSASKATLPTLPLMLEKAYLLSRVHPNTITVRQAAHDLLDKYMDFLRTIPYYKFLEEKTDTASEMDIDSK